MLKNYFPLNLRTIISLIILVRLTTISFAQETATIITTSNDVNWVVNFTNSGGVVLTWQANGAGINISAAGNNPSFDFSPNAANEDITIIVTSNDNFDFVTALLAPGRDITDVDLANMENVKTLEIGNNNLTSITLSTNTALESLDLNNNDLTTINLAPNVNLDEFDASFNNLTSVNLTGLANLEFLDLANNELITLDISGNNLLAQIKLDFNLLTTNAFNQILNDVDAYGTGGFGHILSLTGNPGDVPASAINAYNNLLSRNWIVRPPVIYDFGDAPNTYGTDIASDGAQHIIGDGDLIIGLTFDDELDGFPSVEADGDDLDKTADEDGVNPNDLLGITTSTDNFSVDVDYINNTSSTANLYGWIDFDRSGTFDADEYSTLVVPANSGVGVVTLNWTNIIANGISGGNTYARFRITTDILPSNQPGGAVNNGEVEDYKLSIQGEPDIELEFSEFEEHTGVDELSEIFFLFNYNTPHTFSLVEGDGSSDNTDFSITGKILSKNIIFDYETKKEYFIRIKAKDKDDFSIEKAFVIKVININDIVITESITNNTCSNDSKGAIETFIEEVIPPLSFNWSSGETTQNITNKASGTYTFTVTDSEGMKKSKVFEIETLPIYNDLSICYVTSDNVETFNNRIYLNNVGAYNIDKVEILREGNVQGQYDVIGEINPDEASYLDVTSDNQTVSYNYKVRIKDNCGVDSESSSLHKTILLQANKAADGSINLNWSAYEGISYGTYDIYRKEKQNNTQFELLASISASNLGYNDTEANSNTKSYSYYIAISLANACSFSQPKEVNKSSSTLANDQLKSNIRDIGVVLGIDDEILSASLKIYPNPVAEILTVESKLQLKSIEVYNLLGQEIKIVNDDFESINLNDLSRGIYMIKIHSENGSTVKKLIKQ